MNDPKSKCARAADSDRFLQVDGPSGKSFDVQNLKRSAKNGRFVLTRRSGEAISAVEGLTVSPRMATLVRDMDERGLSRAERRTHIIGLFRKK
ncbi:hypothetical protein [Aureimonas frigidaquae]|uniref:Uncharacterized protein n=1 Tax=Aureimonas frigidaquae TaxID=424757 RepID=A0A0P0Z4B1_9HYPH|nr:hypothetical protein [Aureimonas frigidaquae]BAT28805.1 hypothetical protein [Aureimonas frigidaquae]